MPAPPAGASAARCREQLTQIIEEVAARVPMDAAQGHLAAQCVLAEFLADDMAARIRTPGLSMMEMRQVSRTADDLLRTVSRMERALASDGHDRRGRAGVTLEQGDGWSLEVWPAGAGASVGADLAAQDALTDRGAKLGAATADRAATDRPGPRGVA
jgi:hypothetical protein